MRLVHGAYLADGVIVRGNVKLGAESNIWFGSVIRGDLALISLGERVNVQDGSVLHTDFDVPLQIEAGVVIGHSVVVHGHRVGADTLIGMGARVLSGSEIGAECLIAAGTVVLEGAKIPPRSVVMGVPGKVVRSATVDEIARTRAINARYIEMARKYADGRIEMPYGE